MKNQCTYLQHPVMREIVRLRPQGWKYRIAVSLMQRHLGMCQSCPGPQGCSHSCGLVLWGPEDRLTRRHNVTASVALQCALPPPCCHAAKWTVTHGRQCMRGDCLQSACAHNTGLLHHGGGCNAIHTVALFGMMMCGNAHNFSSVNIVDCRKPCIRVLHNCDPDHVAVMWPSQTWLPLFQYQWCQDDVRSSLPSQTRWYNVYAKSV